MLDAARELFAAKGFAATTREIAECATVTEQLLFNHFGSKQQLFTAAVVRPFEEFVETMLAQWQVVTAVGPEPHRMMREYVEGLYALVVEHQALFRALSDDPFGPHVQPVLDRLETLTAEIAARDGYTFDPHIAVRIVFAAVTTVALHQESLLGDRCVDDIVDELAATLSAGLARQKNSTPATSSGARQAARRSSARSTGRTSTRRRRGVT
jgi:AcrR family transcriptional regulator